MHLQELNDLASWVKKNVLNSYENGDAINVSEENMDDEAKPSIPNVISTKDYKEDISLLEYIIGIN